MVTVVLGSPPADRDPAYGPCTMQLRSVGSPRQCVAALADSAAWLKAERDNDNEPIHFCGGPIGVVNERTPS
jgi:hypothetical protein